MNVWNAFILDPMINSLIWLYGLLGGSIFLAIMLLTVLIRMLVWPLTVQQQRSAKAMQEIQPKLNELQKKYKDDPETMNRKRMELFQENNINPLGGCLPLLIQFPILIGLYRAIIFALASSPLQLMELSQHLYPAATGFFSWLPDATALIPLNSRFAWMDLASPDPLYVLPVLVVASTFIQQRLLTPPTTGDDQQASMTRSMQFTMPLMIGFFSLQFPAGLSVYWVASNIIGTIQYAMMGRASLDNLLGRSEDGSFSLQKFLGLPEPEQQPQRGGARSQRQRTRRSRGR